MISQGISHTAYDVMREYMIIGAELDGKYQIPMLDRYTGHPGEDTVNFKDSFSPKIKNHRKLTVNSTSTTTNLKKFGIIQTDTWNI